MRWLSLFVLATVLAWIQHGALSDWRAPPDLTLALLAWVMVEGEERQLLVRAWLIGVARDLADPGSLVFHALVYLLLAMVFLPVATKVRSLHVFAWSLCAGIAVLVVAVLDAWLGGWGSGRFTALMVSGVLTAAVVIPLGWLARGLPGSWCPLRLPREEQPV